MEDKFRNNFDGEIVISWNESVFIDTDTRKIIWLYTYRRFAIVKLTYKSKGRFELFVPDSTRYWDTHDTPELLPFEGRIVHHSEFDSVGMYKAHRRGEKKESGKKRWCSSNANKDEKEYESECENDSQTEYDLTDSDSSTMVNIFTGRPWGYMTPDDSD